MEWNGMEWNEMEWNHLDWRGMECNGMERYELFGGGENILKFTVVMVAQFCEYIKNHGIGYSGG